MSSRRIQIFDTTLRDGEQSPGIALRPEQKAEVAEQLERLGVDVIEAGFAAASPGDFEGVRAVADVARRATVASLCRTRREDLDAGADALRDAHRSRIHIFLATSPIHMDEVEFSCEDATRSDPSFVARVCREAIAAGADVVNLPDTVGFALPNEYAWFFGEVRRLCPELENVTISAHCHDDLGLAVANSLAAVEAGVGQVECTVNGIGERAGNAALEEIVMALRVRHETLGVDTGIDPAEIGPSSALVSRLTGYDVPPNKAIVGANAFAHEAGIHQDGLLKDASTYQIIEPKELGLAMTLPLGKHSGRHAFARACSDAGLQLDEELLTQAFMRFKALADTGQHVSLNALFVEVSAA